MLSIFFTLACNFVIPTDSSKEGKRTKILVELLLEHFGIRKLRSQRYLVGGRVGSVGTRSINLLVRSQPTRFIPFAPFVPPQFLSLLFRNPSFFTFLYYSKWCGWEGDVSGFSIQTVIIVNTVFQKSLLTCCICVIISVP